MSQAVLHSAGDAIDYQPTSAVSAGDVVVQNGLLGVVQTDIAANALGSLSVKGVYKMPKADGEGDVEVGIDAYWDEDGNPSEGTEGTGAITATSTGNTYAGVTVPKPGADVDDYASASADNYIYVRLQQMTPEYSAGS